MIYRIIANALGSKTEYYRGRIVADTRDEAISLAKKIAPFPLGRVVAVPAYHHVKNGKCLRCGLEIAEDEKEMLCTD